MAVASQTPPTDQQLDQAIEELFEGYDDNALCEQQLLRVARALAKSAWTFEQTLMELAREEPAAQRALAMNTDRHDDLLVAGVIVRHWKDRLDVPA